MIDAYEAYQKSMLNAQAKTYIKKIENAVTKAIRYGEFEAKINHGLTDGGESAEISKVIVESITELGYEVFYQAAKELPAGCRSDQWDFENGHILIKKNKK